MRRLILPAFALLLAACSGGRPGGDLDVVVVGEGTLAEELAQEASRATLIRRGSGGEVVAGVATSWRFLDDGDDLCHPRDLRLELSHVIFQKFSKVNVHACTCRCISCIIRRR